MQKVGIAGATTAGLWTASGIVGLNFVVAAGSSACGTGAVVSPPQKIALTPDQAVQNWTVKFTPPAGGGTYTFQYVYSFANGTGSNGVADDIGVTAPAITCKS